MPDTQGSVQSGSPSGQLGGSDFTTTHWTVVRQATGDSPQAMAALETLARAYWNPLYAYVRRYGRSPHDSQDLTQAFFARLLEHGYLQLADRNQGRFRTFLLSSLKNFLKNEWRKENCESRGGGQKVLSLDDHTAETRFAPEAFVKQPPDSLFDRPWAATLWERALTSLRSEFEQSGKLDSFERLKVYVWGDKNALSYAEMAAEMKMTEGAVKVSVHRLRKRYGELLRAEVAQTVSTLAEVDKELRYLLSVIRDELANSGNLAPEKL